MLKLLFNISGSLYYEIASLGVIVAVIVYFLDLRTKKLTNAVNIVSTFYNYINENDIKNFERVIAANSKALGGDGKGHWMDTERKMRDFGSYYTDTPSDGGSLHKITVELERICYLLMRSNACDKEYVYTELGQFLTVTHTILCAIDMKDRSGGRCDFLIDDFPNIKKFYDFAKEKYTNTPSRVFGYID